MTHDLVYYPDEGLLTPTKEWDFGIKEDHNPIEFAHELSKQCLTLNGVGIAANQIGVNKSVFAVKSNPMIVCYNPRIVHKSKETIVLDEGCLSLPGFVCKIRRSRTIRVRYTEPNGNVVTKTFDGMTARVFQHEMMHLEGKYFFEGASRLKIEQGLKKALKAGYDYSQLGLMKHSA